MKKLALTALVALLALLLATAATSQPIAAAISDMPADYPATGDKWNYTVTQITPLVNVTGNATLEMTGVVKIKAGVNESKEYECYNYTLVLEMIHKDPTSGTEAQMKTIVQTYYSMDGNVTAAYTYSLTKTITPAGGAVIVFEAESSGYTHYSDTWKMFDFPLAEGKNWSKTVDVYLIGSIIYRTNATGQWTETKTVYDWSNATKTPTTFAGKVVNVTTVKTGAGTFECWLVNSTTTIVTPYVNITSYALLWYNPEVKNVVYREEYEVPPGGTTAVLTRTFNLTSYSVSYPMRTMIQSLLVLTLLQQMVAQQQAALIMKAGIAIVAAVVIIGVAAYLARKR